jgi:hypothetical protein
MEIRYFPHGSKITDYSIKLDSKCVGVSVTRAMTFGKHYTTFDAERLLQKKLFGVINSTKNGTPRFIFASSVNWYLVMREDGWIKQILHILTPNSCVLLFIYVHADLCLEKLQILSKRRLISFQAS